MTTEARSAAAAPRKSGRRSRRFAPDEPGGQRGEDQHRLEPLTEDDDRRVRDDGEARARPGADGCLRVGERGVERLARRGDLLDGRLAADELREPCVAVRSVPEEPLRCGEEIGGEAAQPLLRPELEERVRLEPCLLGRRVLAGTDGVDDPVERRADDVEVGGGARVLPLLWEDPLGELERLVRLRLDGLGRGHGGTLVRRGERLAELGHEHVDPAHRGRVTLDEHALEIGDGLRSAVAERDRLLNLERHRDTAVRDSTLVLDRDESEEAEELAGAPDLLLGRERSGPEALEGGVDGRTSLRVRAPVRGQGRGHQAIEVRGGARALGGVALSLEGGPEDGEVPARDRGLGGDPRAEAVLRSFVRGLERGSQKCLVGVEVVGADGCGSLLRRALAVGEQVERERGVGTRSGETRRRPKLPDEKPALRLGHRARLDRAEHLGIRRAENRDAELRPLGREAPRVLAGYRSFEGSQALPKRRLADELREANEARPRLPHDEASLVGVTEDERALGVRERRPYVCLELPRLLLGRAHS